MDPRPQKPRKYVVVFDHISTVKAGDMVVCPSSGCWIGVEKVTTDSEGNIELTWVESRPPGCDGFVGSPNLELAVRRQAR
jgi:hypothetical protein